MPICMELPSEMTSGETGVYYELPEDHPNSPYPPPTFIDFASGALRPPFPPTRPSAISFHCQWLGGPHDGYPLTTTLDEYVQLRQNGSAIGTIEYAALVQSQLTFGLLEAILRTKIPESFLLARAAVGTIPLSIDHLPVLCRDLYHRLRVKHHPDKCRLWLEDIPLILSDAYRRLWTYRWSSSTNPFLAAGLPQEAFEDILRALSMIGHSLKIVLLESSARVNPEVQSIPHLDFDKLPDTKPAQDQLRAEGCCPLTLATLEMCGVELLEYARSVPPFFQHAGEHDRCTIMACRVNHINPDTYIQKHSAEECTCASAIPPFHDVESFLSSGRIPVVTASDEGLSVLAAENVPYVAISHVWIDGLGSTTEEGLPACQVARIASMASSLAPGCAFWIDGICVPKQKDLRKRAIQLMAKTYTEATAVLVIDASIRCCSKRAPLEEKLLRIYTSGWMQRLWTYQEAMLAQSLWFELADGLVDLKDLLPSHEQLATGPLLYTLCPTLDDIRYHMSERGSANYSLPIFDIMYAVQWRTTSRIEDETLAIAGLLQIDVRKLLDASSPDERMKSLLLQTRTVSPDIIFATDPKISCIPGFSWAPRSFMTGPHSRVWSNDESAICTPTGLLTAYAAFRFSEPVELDEDTLYVIRDTARQACSFLLQPAILVRDGGREFCNAILCQGNCSNVRGSDWACVGVRMVDEQEETIGDSEKVCQYRNIHLYLRAISLSEESSRQADGFRVIDAKWCPRMKVKVV